MARGLEPAGVAFIAENLDNYVRDLGKADKAQQGLGDSAEGSSGKLNLLGSVVTGVATAFTTFAIDAVMKASQALVGLAQDSIGVATEFESSMAILTISASGVEEELVNLGFGMEDLSEITLAVGGDTRLLGVSASGSAEAITGLFKAGLTAQDVFGDLQGYMEGTADLGGALRASIDLAAATTLDMAQASDLAAIALSTFGGQAEEAGMTADEFIVMAMDNLVRTADASVAEVEGLAEALKMVGPTAGAMSISIQDTNNALALLSTRGIQGSMAGTSLNRMLLDLGKTTPKATAAMEALGIVTYDEQGAMLPLVDIIGQFEIALGDATDAERDAALQAIFTAQGMRSMNVLMGEGIEGWVGMEDAIEGAATMMEQGEARAQTLAAQQEALDGVIETLKIRIGTALLPALTGITTAFSGLVEKYGPMVSAAFEKIGAVLGDLVNWFVVVLEEGDLLNDFLVNLPGPFQSIVEIVTDLIGRFESMTKVFERGGLEAIFTVWQDGSTAMGYFLEGLGLSKEAALGISNVIGSVVDTIDRIRQWFVENGPAIESALDQIGQVFGMVFGSIKEVVEDIWPIFEEIGATFEETSEVVREVLEELGLNFDDTGSGIETVTGIIIGVIEVMGGIISGVLTAIAGMVKFFAERFQDIWMSIRDVVQGVKEWFEGFKQFWTSLFEGDLPGALEGLEKGFSGFAKFIKSVVKIIVKSITAPFEGLYKLIEGFVKGVIKFFKNLKKKLVGGSIIPDMMDKIEKVIDVVLNAILKVWETIFEKILDTTEKVFATIERTVDRVMTTVEKIIDTITTAIGGDWEDFVDLLFELWEETWEDIQDAVDTIFSAIEALIDRIIGSIESLWDSFTETLEEVWTDAWDSIQEAVDRIFSAIETAIDTISGQIETAWGTFTGALETVWNTAWGNISDALDTIFEGIETAIDTISGRIETAWDTFTAAIQTAWDTVWGAMQTSLTTIYEAIETAISTISGRVQTAWNTFTGALQTAWDTIWGNIQDVVGVDGVFESIETAIDTISGRIKTTWDTWVGNLKTAFETMFNALSGVVTAAMSAVSTAVSSALSALAGILAVGETLYNSIMTIGHNIAGAIKDGVVALWSNVTGAIKTKLEALGAAGTFGLEVWRKVQDLGKKIVNFIKSGLVNLWGAAGGLVAALKTKLGELGDALGTAWNAVKEIGGRILNKIMQGVKAGTAWAANFWSWLWGEILAWLRWHSGEEVGEMMGDKITDGLVDSIRSQTGVRLLDALDYAVGEALRGGIETDMIRATAGFTASLGLVAPAMMAPAAVASRGAEVTIGPNYINDGMDLAEFEVRVRQAVSEAI